MQGFLYPLFLDIGQDAYFHHPDAPRDTAGSPAFTFLTKPAISRRREGLSSFNSRIRSQGLPCGTYRSGSPKRRNGTWISCSDIHSATAPPRPPRMVLFSTVTTALHL